MAAARRYAIASYDRTGLARLMYLRPAVGTAFALALAAFFALFMYAGRTVRRAPRRWPSSSSSRRSSSTTSGSS